jgi:restriction system protein
VPVPDFQTLMLPVLTAFADGCENVSQVIPRLRAEFGVTPQDAEELIPSGRKTRLADRAHWARTYLSKAGLLESPSRNTHHITERGRQVLATSPTRIDSEMLSKFEDFSTWKERSIPSVPRAVGKAKSDVTSDVFQTPEEQIAGAFATLETELQAEILDLVTAMQPVRFERLILDLLNAMGYGAGALSASMMTKASGDGGIDGIIHEDALGLDAVYIQAKRYAVGSTVGRPAIQQFVGSLTGEGATKGVFVTTSDFSAEARGYLGKVQHRIVLINGSELARLMIRHGVGVRPRSTYVVKGVDDDYFADANAI